MDGPHKSKEIVKCHKKNDEMNMKYTWLNLNDIFFFWLLTIRYGDMPNRVSTLSLKSTL